MITALLLLAAAAPSPERCAAMLLSPNAEMRKAGTAALEQVDAKAVLAVLAKRAHSRTAWIDDLEQELGESTQMRHAEVRELLAILRGSTEDNVGVDLVMVSMPNATAAELLGEGAPAVVFEKGDAWQRWWTAIGGAEGAELVVKTSLPGKDALEVEVEKKRRIGYVKDFVLEGNVGGPVVDEVEAGLSVRWRPVLATDGRHVTLDFDVLLKDIVRPIAVKEKQVGPLKAKIQVPELKETRRRTALTLPLGGCAAFPFASNEQNTTVCFVRAALGAPRGVPELPIPAARVGVVEKRQPVPPR